MGGPLSFALVAQMLYVYAFCPPLPTPSALPTGITGAAVQVVTVDTLGAIAESGVDVAQLKADDDQLMQAVLTHDRVLNDLFAQVPLLPLRFGTQFNDEEALSTFLHQHSATYQARLTALCDRAEYLLKLTPQPLPLPDLDPNLKGRDYFLAKKERLQAQTAAVTQQSAEFEAFLAQLEAHQTPFVLSTPQDTEERLYLLLSRDAAATQTAVAQWQQQLPTWQLGCSEPLPPYHFAT
ncbi:MAG TPA: GvpL/GvpF family gas vesicle protein [Candidatus Obscuribacterales bacterium]